MPHGKRHYNALPICFSTGSLCGWLLPALPPGWLLLLLWALCAALLLPRPTRTAATCLLGLTWLLTVAGSHYSKELKPEQGGVLATVTGFVASLPQRSGDQLRFKFTADSGQQPNILLVRWYRDYPSLRGGERLRLKVKLKPPRGRVNFQGFDYERWLLGEGIQALADVRSGEIIGTTQSGISTALLRLRSHLSANVAQSEFKQAPGAVMQALLVGDRTRLSRENWQLFAATGSSHLIAISGLHVGMVAMFGFLLGRLLYLLLPKRRSRFTAYHLGVAAALLCSLVYSALAGFVVPTQRALIMTAIALLVFAGRRSIRPWTAYFWALALVLSLQPLSPAKTGFWLSFGAVAVLIYGFSGRFTPRTRVMSYWQILLKAQLLVVIGLIPFNAIWFQQLSLAAIAANLVAIPLMSFILLPLLLLYLPMSLLHPGMAEWLLQGAALSAELLLRILTGLSQLQAVVPLTKPGALVTAVALAGVIMLLAPKHYPGRCLGLLCLLPLFSQPLPLAPGQWRLQLLDVGQGTAVALQTSQHSLLYDTGPGDGQNRHLVDSVIVPALSYWGIRQLDKIVISHGDNDHAGGRQGLRQRYPGAHWLASLPAGSELPRTQPCLAGQQWDWTGVEFQLLHPTPFLPYLGNNSSCVLRIASDKGSVLLAGDIEAVIEARLLRRQETLHSSLLLVPHHGSKSSSSAAFVDAVAADYGLVSAAYMNRFGLPADAVLERYQRAGTVIWNSAACGAVEAATTATGELLFRSARRERKGFWRKHPAPSCP